MEKLWNNLETELKKFFDKNGFKTAVLGLSGGLDSAVVAVLAAKVLGGNNVSALMMKTKYTSDLSLKIAREIALTHKLKYLEINIDELVEKEVELLRATFNEKLKGVVIENLQARIRGQILMAYSNQYGAMVLASGNKSEIYTGYCTIYGDTCGGVMPIGNIYKSTIFELAKWLNLNENVLPKEVIYRAPSAELSFNQKDENSLPKYEILDDILRQMVDENKDMIKGDSEVINRVRALYNNSAFKREQLPFILKV